MNKNQGFFIAKMNSKKNQWKINQWKWEKNGRRLRNIGIWTWKSKKGVGKGTENEDERLGALPSTTACY